MKWQPFKQCYVKICQEPSDERTLHLYDICTYPLKNVIKSIESTRTSIIVTPIFFQHTYDKWHTAPPDGKTWHILRSEDIGVAFVYLKFSLFWLPLLLMLYAILSISYHPVFFYNGLLCITINLFLTNLEMLHKCLFAKSTSMHVLINTVWNAAICNFMNRR